LIFCEQFKKFRGNKFLASVGFFKNAHAVLQVPAIHFNAREMLFRIALVWQVLHQLN
jgi:hypothetical protein